MFRAGGVCLLIDGIIFIILIPLFFVIGEMGGGEEALKFIAENDLLLRTTVGLSALAPAFFVPGMLALYLSMKDIRRTHTVISTGLFGLAMTLFLGSTIVQYSLIELGKGYMGATDAAQRAAYVAVSELAGRAATAGETLGTIFFSVAVLIMAMVMLKGVFSRATAYLSIINGLVGVVSSIPITALGLLSIISTVILAVWFLVVGYTLYKMG